MTNLPFVQHDEALKDLCCNFLGLRSGLKWMVGHVLAEISMRDIFHCDINRSGVLVPAKEDNEEVVTLLNCTQPRTNDPSSALKVRLTSCKSINASIS